MVWDINQKTTREEDKMSNISIDTVEELASLSSISYIRPTTITLTGSMLKPSTRHNIFFNDTNVNHLATQQGKAQGDPLISDANGILFATLDIPGFKFPAGNIPIVLTQENNTTIPPGSNTSRADATFITFDSESMYNINVEGSVVTVEESLRKSIALPVQPQVSLDDAIAQSFFTYGVDGGIYVTSIELFFESKDNFLPVSVELRDMVNGYPGKNFLSPYAISSVNAANVVTGGSSTKFTFPKLIFLPQDRDYCFVVRSRSNNYKVRASRIGEYSSDAGLTVTEQPFTGSVFKTDNNITWSTEQMEDLKFILNRAEFNTNVNAVVKMSLTAQPVVSGGSYLQTMENSNVVILTSPHKHGLDTNSKIRLACDPLGNYNGVAGTVMNNVTCSVFKLFNDYSVAINVPGATFTSIGPMEYGGRVQSIAVLNGGSGYSSATPPTVNISAPNVTGTQATATAVVEDGKIARITVNNKGTGYTGPTTVTITSAVGSGATAMALNNAYIGVSTNRVYNYLTPTLSYGQPEGTEVAFSVGTTLAQFEGGSLSNYVTGPEYTLIPGMPVPLYNNLLLASRYNEENNMSNEPSCVVEATLSSTNSKISPVIDMNNSSFVFYNNRVNDLYQDEDILSTSPTGSLSTVTITSGGSGYTSAPNVTIAGVPHGAYAALTATISGGVVTAINIVDPGKGFLYAPSLIFTGGNPTVKAAATSTITKFNSELLPNNGLALSKYVTKAQILDTLSNSIKLYATGYSNIDSSFEFYIKTSISSSNIPHNDNNWKLLSCDVTRNKSEKPEQQYEYEFYADNLETFDTYSIKIVLRSKTPWDPPYISKYRAILLS